MATVLSSETSTTIVVSPDEAVALEIILSDWRNTASQAIQDGYDPHGYTQQTWNQIVQLAGIFGVETELDIETDHICWTDDTLCPECGSENNLPNAISSNAMVMVEWVSIGEGLQGEYDPDNPDDVELLRYDAYVASIDPDTDEERGLEIDFMRDGWGTLQDNSYCTQTPASTPRETLKQLAQLMADRLADKLDAGWKRTAEEMSWAHPDWVTPTN